MAISEMEAEMRKQRIMERIRKVEEIISDITNNREDVITRRTYGNGYPERTISFCGKIGENVLFTGTKKESISKIYSYYEGTQINLKYLDEQNQRQPLCQISVQQRTWGKKSLIDVHPQLGNAVEREKVEKAYNFEKYAPKSLHVYHAQGEDADVLVDEIYNLVNRSKQKAAEAQTERKVVNAPKLNKLNIPANEHGYKVNQVAKKLAELNLPTTAAKKLVRVIEDIDTGRTME